MLYLPPRKGDGDFAKQEKFHYLADISEINYLNFLLIFKV